MISRLPEAKEDLVIDKLVINKKLRPYLTEWYLGMKNDGETSEQFILRSLKDSAMEAYINNDTKVKVLEFQTAIESLQADAGVIVNEVD